MSETILETERLILRHLTLEDIDDLAIIYADPDVMRFFPSGPRTREQTEASIRANIQLYEACGFGLWATVYKPENRFIGRCGLLPQEIDGVAEREIAYMIARDYWGRGLASEAASAIRDYGFHQLGLSRLISMIHADNIGSQRVAEKIGLHFEQEIIMDHLPCRIYALHRQ